MVFFEWLVHQFDSNLTLGVGVGVGVGLGVGVGSTVRMRTL